MQNTRCAEIVLQFKTLNMLSRKYLGIRKHSGRAWAILMWLDENAPTRETSCVYNSLRAWEFFSSVFLKPYKILESRLVLLALSQ